MAITTQLYIPDGGSVSVNDSEVNGSVITVTPSVPRRSERTVNALGGSKTDVQDRDQAGPMEVSLEIYDDRSLADDPAALLTILWTAYYTNTPLTGLKVVPAGNSQNMVEYTYGGDIHVVQCPPHGTMDANTEDEATVQAVIIFDTVTTAQVA